MPLATLFAFVSGTVVDEVEVAEVRSHLGKCDVCARWRRNAVIAFRDVEARKNDPEERLMMQAYRRDLEHVRSTETCSVPAHVYRFSARTGTESNPAPSNIFDDFAGMFTIYRENGDLPWMGTLSFSIPREGLSEDPSRTHQLGNGSVRVLLKERGHPSVRQTLELSCDDSHGLISEAAPFDITNPTKLAYIKLVHCG